MESFEKVVLRALKETPNDSTFYWHDESLSKKEIIKHFKKDRDFRKAFISKVFDTTITVLTSPEQG
ncbi:hypothetical protein J7K27_06260 [Candidatus Bathyarchaeota archaeon]|nr:hypothetical protein [Candidatus Bathyarchaeota archaeon]